MFFLSPPCQEVRNGKREGYQADQRHGMCLLYEGSQARKNKTDEGERNSRRLQNCEDHGKREQGTTALTLSKTRSNCFAQYVVKMRGSPQDILDSKS